MEVTCILLNFSVNYIRQPTRKVLCVSVYPDFSKFSLMISEIQQLSFMRPSNEMYCDVMSYQTIFQYFTAIIQYIFSIH